jgi:hypothetical protein
MVLRPTASVSSTAIGRSESEEIEASSDPKRARSLLEALFVFILPCEIAEAFRPCQPVQQDVNDFSGLVAKSHHRFLSDRVDLSGYQSGHVGIVDVYERERSPLSSRSTACSERISP